MGSFKKLAIRDVVWQAIIKNQLPDLVHNLANGKYTLRPILEMEVHSEYFNEGRITVSTEVKLSRNFRVRVEHEFDVQHCSQFFEKKGNDFVITLDNEKRILHSLVTEYGNKIQSAFKEIESDYSWDFFIKISSIIARVPDEKEIIFKAGRRIGKTPYLLTNQDGWGNGASFSNLFFRFTNAKYLHLCVPEEERGFWGSYITFLISGMAKKIENSSDIKGYHYKPFTDLLRLFINDYQYWIVYGFYAEQERKVNDSINDLKLGEKIHKDILKHINRTHSTYWMEKSIEQADKVKKTFKKLVELINS